LALHRVGGIGHELQLMQDKLRDQHNAVEEVRFADIRDAAIDNHACIQHFGHAPGAPLAAEETSEGRQVEHVSFIRSDYQTNVGHHQKQPDVQKRPRSLRDRRARQNRPIK